MSIQKRREAEKQARIDSIKKSAWKIFLRDGLHKSKIAEIASGCSLGLSTLYYYFKDKRQLTYALMLDYKKEKHEEHLILMQGATKGEFIERYIRSYLDNIDRFRFFVLADSYHNYHGEYDLTDPVIQEYDRVTHENGTYILNSLARDLSDQQWDRVQVGHSMIIGFLRRYVLLPEISLPPSEEKREEMLRDFVSMSLKVFADVGVELDSPIYPED